MKVINSPKICLAFIITSINFCFKWKCFFKNLVLNFLLKLSSLKCWINMENGKDRKFRGRLFWNMPA